MRDDDSITAGLLVCTPETLRAPAAPPALTLQRIDATAGSDALREFTVAVTPTEGECAPEPTAAQVAAITTGLRDGLGVLARMSGVPVGGGLFTLAPDGQARIETLRLRDPDDTDGVGPVIAAELARSAFRTGARQVALRATGDRAPTRFAGAGFVLAA